MVRSFGGEFYLTSIFPLSLSQIELIFDLWCFIQICIMAYFQVDSLQKVCHILFQKHIHDLMCCCYYAYNLYNLAILLSFSVYLKSKF